MSKIILNGCTLTRRQVIEVACHHAKVEINPSRIAESRDYITQKVEENKIIYGVTTGFGSNADKLIEKKDTLALQLNLLRSHACGTGSPFSREITRAIMVIRLNTLLIGHSGIQLSTVEQLAFLLNNDIHPVIPEQGSVGASGDLCPLSHMALPLIGEGEIEYQDKTYNTADFLNTPEAKKIGFRKAALSYKEGLALNNGTTVMTAVAVIALHRAERLLKVNTLSSALIFESLCARQDAFAYARVHEARGHHGQTTIASWLSAMLQGSKLINMGQGDILTALLQNGMIPDDIIPEIRSIAATADDEQVQIPEPVINKVKTSGDEKLAGMLSFARKKWKPQDSYSIRCVPQVFGASKTAIDHATDVIDAELNAAVDNPLIFADDNKVVSGGNFHGQPIALVMDYLKLALAEIGNITERQINKMVDSNTNDCLEGFLVYGKGLISGLMIPQYAAASIVSENKVLVHPASADSIPTSANTEDHVSMGTIAARQAVQIADNVEKITAIAIMTGFYAINMRLHQFREMKMENDIEKTLAPATLAFYKAIKNANKEFEAAAVTNDNNGFLQTDRYLRPEIDAIREQMSVFAGIAENYVS